MNKSRNNTKAVGEFRRVGDRGVVQHAAILERYQGPIPNASELKKYEEVLPGAADRILLMAEKQAEHRQKIETSAIKSNIENSKRGQLFAFVISLIVIGVGFVLILLDKSGWGLAMIIGDLAILAAVFMGNRIREIRELARKRRPNEPDDES